MLWIAPWPLNVQALRGRLREVVLAPADVGAAVDHGHAEHATAVAQRDLAPARERLVRDAEIAGVERAAAAQGPAVQAGPVPRGVCRASTRSAARAGASRPGPVTTLEHARARSAATLHAITERSPAASVLVPVERDPAALAADLQRDGRAGRAGSAAHEGTTA